MFAHAAIEAFRDRRTPNLPERFKAFSLAEWAEGLAWLDAQEMQGYFLRRFAELGLEHAIPRSLLLQARERCAETERNSAQMFDHFVQINDCLQAAGIAFCNVRGFALVPALRAEPLLRRLSSHELLVLDTDCQRCRERLVALGCAANEISENIWGANLETENHAGATHTDSATRQRRVRIHFVAAAEEGEWRAGYHMLMRRRPQMWKGFIFNAPSASDNLLAQAIHIENQLEKGSVVLADLFEFAQCMRFWARADEFWQEVVERSMDHPRHAGAVGAAAMAVSKLFGSAMPAALWQLSSQAPNKLLLPFLEQFELPAMDRSGSLPNIAPVNARRTVSYPLNKSRVDKADDTQLLERICAAYNKAIEDAPRYSREYRASPWWKSVERKNLSQVQAALRAHDTLALRGMYHSFYRTACGTGLVRRPLEIGGSRSQFDPDQAELCVIREDSFYRLGYWRVQTDGRLPLSALQGPDVGNPFGVIVDGVLIAAGAEFHHACAHRIAQFTGPKPTIVEIGGGFGNMAYYLLKAKAGIKYVDFDMPESLALTAYYLGKSSPGRAMLLYGEMDLASIPEIACEVALMPPWTMEQLADKSVGLTFSSHILWDLVPSAREKYLESIARFTKGILLDISNEKDHSSQACERLFTCAEKRPSYWNLYRAPDAKEWEQVLLPRG